MIIISKNTKLCVSSISVFDCFDKKITNFDPQFEMYMEDLIQNTTVQKPKWIRVKELQRAENFG